VVDHQAKEPVLKFATEVAEVMKADVPVGHLVRERIMPYQFPTHCGLPSMGIADINSAECFTFVGSQILEE